MTAIGRKVILVTGANKGIGLEIVRRLLSPESKQDIHVLLASRKPENAAAAVELLQKEGSPVERLSTLQLDIDDPKSVEAAAEHVKATYGKIHGLVNNAGMAWKGKVFDETVARTTIGTNYFGTLRVSDAFLPLLSDTGRLVNVSSMAGRSALRNMSDELRARFLDDNISIEQLNALMNKFIQDVKAGTWKEQGWPESTYGVSKAGVTIMTRIHAREWGKKAPGLLINCCCPGWCRTDMAGPTATKSAAEGAVTPTMLALLPDGAPSGKFWENCEVADFV